MKSMINFENLEHLKILRHELQARKSMDPAFSLRGFARFLGIDAGSLSRIMNGKQDLSLRSAILIVRRLGFSGDESKRFLSSVADEKIREITETLAQASFEAGQAPFDQDADNEPNLRGKAQPQGSGASPNQARH